MGKMKRDELLLLVINLMYKEPDERERNKLRGWGERLIMERKDLRYRDVLEKVEKYKETI